LISNLTDILDKAENDQSRIQNIQTQENPIPAPDFNQPPLFEINNDEDVDSVIRNVSLRHFRHSGRRSNVFEDVRF